MACKLLYELFETGKIARSVSLAGNDLEFAAAFVVGDEVRFGSADVSCDEHSSRYFF